MFKFIYKIIINFYHKKSHYKTFNENKKIAV